MVSIQIECAELSAKLAAGEDLLLIDCREPHENAICSLPGSRLIPMREVPQALTEIGAAKGEVVVYCHHGMRSLNVVNWLRSQGVEGARSLAGGIDRWSLERDPAVPRY